ncbi:hypothetical protein [Agromyces rhizosphaerae]|uniref:hypothetical protein n=1 Tax=Agromyces rhizosphaerae TaxID=88374 RepID=UPI002493210F|nr:hypothetical protein [Agromyces rhizosphaerae]
MHALDATRQDVGARRRRPPLVSRTGRLWRRLARSIRLGLIGLGSSTRPAIPRERARRLHANEAARAAREGHWESLARHAPLR